VIVLVGDTHGNIDFGTVMSLKDRGKKLGFSKEKTKLIILGDFAVLWKYKPDRLEERLLKWYEKAPWTTLVIDGNHENHDRLAELETVQMFGGDVGIISDTIFHLRRGRVYTIDGKSIFTCGGGQSIDKARRVEFKSWWRNELLSYKEQDDALGNLEKVGNQVDYVLTHEAPIQFVPKFLNKDPEGAFAKGKSPVANFFGHLYDILTFKHWYCGHYHVDETIDNVTTMYRKSVFLEDE
jgi:DNA repair exonuclease SbcCD nuclease subunit